MQKQLTFSPKVCRLTHRLGAAAPNSITNFIDFPVYHFMASDTAYCIRSDTNPHGVGYVLVPKARKGSFHMFNKPRTGHHDIPTDESQNRLALYMFMDHVALDNRNLYESSQYKVCEHHSHCRESKINKHVSGVPPTCWKVRRSS